VFVCFNEEFAQANKGQIRVFYVGTRDQPRLLSGYRKIETGM
jgi:hypothetical protein